MSDTAAAVLAAIESLRGWGLKSISAAEQKKVDATLSALEALVKEREALENGGHEEICNASAASLARLADFVAAVGK